MSILKNKNYNVFLSEIISIILILFVSLIPWLEFLNNNYNEINEIFNDSFFFLIGLYFLFVTLFYYLTKIIFKDKNKIFYISLIGISIWIFFQHNLLKSIFNDLFKTTNIWHFSSEIALFIIVVLIIILTFFLIKNKNWQIFFLTFLIINFFYSSIIFFPNISSLKIKNNELSQNDSNLIELSSKSDDKVNIYFFLIDSFKPLDEFEKFYNTQLKDFRNFIDVNEYKYYENTSNLYMWTEPVLTSMFYLEENIYNSNSDNNDFVNWTEIYKNKTLKSDIKETFPIFLKDGFKPKLLKELDILGYKFRWAGNYVQNCSYTNYKYCLKDQKRIYIDLYTLQAFLSKSAIVQIFDKLVQIEFINNFIDIKILHSDAIFELNNFVVSNKDYLEDMGPTFFFIHDMEPHEPYFVDSTCANKRFPGKYNLEGYKNSYLCVIKKITNVIETLEKIDPNAIVIFQSDHSWIMSEKSQEQYGKRNNIFNLVKNNSFCSKNLPDNPNATNITKHVINCLKKSNMN